MTVSTTAARHLLVRLGAPARLPDAIHDILRDEVVLTGWMRASGMLSDVELRAGHSGSPRKLSGQVQVIALEGSIGLSGGDVSVGLRAVLSRETESGLETISGDIVSAQVEALEVWITAFDEVTATRQQDRAGVWVLDVTDSAGRIVPSSPSLPARSEDIRSAVTAPAPAGSSGPAAPVFLHAAPVQSGFAEASRTVVEAPRPAAAAPPRPPAPASQAPPPARPSPTFSASAAMPQRIAKPILPETEDDPVPEPGDTAEHFAFGQCEVVKSEGDRLHVRLVKDQRIKEIALEMLKVSALPAAEGQTSRHWKLSRKM